MALLVRVRLSPFILKECYVRVFFDNVSDVYWDNEICVIRCITWFGKDKYILLYKDMCKIIRAKLWCWLIWGGVSKKVICILKGPYSKKQNYIVDLHSMFSGIG